MSASLDLWNIPLRALNINVRKRLGLFLNPRNTVASDWMSVAENMGFSYLEIKNYEDCQDPTRKILEDWQARCPGAKVGKLVSILDNVDRKDVVEDLRVLIGKPTAFYSEIPDNVSLSLCPGARSKRLIPVKYRSMKKAFPSILRILTMCDYTQPCTESWFWVRLAKALSLP
ncbi:myeloid differentiation primary response protein MyD88-like [Oncorhynchus masou masou]|uniref:myeloid differentiation primary response protein MyD88-like n=1 Tax=Oncorhynchus masou masou TaxID=90313 RepID=UPI0031834802